MEEKKNDNLATELLHHLAVQNKRLFIALVTILVIFFVENLAWLYVFNQYDFQSYELNSEDGGNANFIGNDGDITNGNGESKTKNEEEPSDSKGNGYTKAEEEVNGNQRVYKTGD